MVKRSTPVVGRDSPRRPPLQGGSADQGAVTAPTRLRGVDQVRLRLDAAELGRFDQAVEEGSPAGPAAGAPMREWPPRSAPTPPAAARPGGRARRCGRRHPSRPRPGTRALHGVELPDEVQHLGTRRRIVRLRLDELAADVRPAMGEGEARAGARERIIRAVTISSSCLPWPPDQVFRSGVCVYSSLMRNCKMPDGSVSLPWLRGRALARYASIAWAEDAIGSSARDAAAISVGKASAWGWRASAPAP